MRNHTEYEQVSRVRRNNSRRRRSVYLNKLFLGFAAVITAIGIGILGIGQLADAHEETLRKTASDSYYKSIEIQAGDTLWEIAQEYRTADYDSLHAYINELKAVNGLTSDEIQAGQYLTVIYSE